ALHYTTVVSISALAIALLFPKSSSLHYQNLFTLPLASATTPLRRSHAPNISPTMAHIPCMLLGVASGPFTATGSASEMRRANRARRLYIVRWHMDKHGLSAVH
ncbi:hypothetical protein COCCADRAFT_109647, partial [Bipolaris zeicola 26-R-13]